MAQSVPARLSGSYSAADGRKFGATLGAAFVVLALVARWRGHPATVVVLGVLGIVMLGASLIVPTSLGAVERRWMTAANAFSRITTPLFMGVLYYIVLTPIALVRRTIGGNPLVHRADRLGFWTDRRDARGSMDRQF